MWMQPVQFHPVYSSDYNVARVCLSVQWHVLWCRKQEQASTQLTRATGTLLWTVRTSTESGSLWLVQLRKQPENLNPRAHVKLIEKSWGNSSYNNELQLTDIKACVTFSSYVHKKGVRAAFLMSQSRSHSLVSAAVSGRVSNWNIVCVWTRWSCPCASTCNSFKLQKLHLQ